MDARPPPVVEIGVLGPIRAVAGDAQVAVGGQRRRALLARLAVDHGATVSLDGLVDAVWPDAPPPKAQETLRTYVARLRRALEVPGVRSGHDVLETTPGGYRLASPHSRLDAQRVERAVAGARRALEHGDPDEAVTLLAAALRRWRGDAYGVFAERIWAHPEALRLHELRTTAQELHVLALTDAGDLEEAVARGRALVAVHPLRESAVELLVRAHCRSGRQADAMAALDAHRRRLSTTTALRPSARMARLVDAVRRGDLSRANAPAGRPTRDTSREEVATVLGAAVRSWLDGDVDDARATVRRATVLDTDVRLRLGRWLRLLEPTDGLVRLLATECARAWARSPDLGERCMASLDAYALSHHPDGVKTARREVDEEALDHGRALRVRAFATMHAPLGDGFAEAVELLGAQPDPVLRVEARRMRVVLRARRGALDELPALLDAYEAAAVRAGVDGARDFARTSRIVLGLAGGDGTARPVPNGVASSTIKNAVLDLATLWRQLAAGEVGPTTTTRVRALRHAGLTPVARDALLAYVAVLSGDEATARAQLDGLVGGLGELRCDPFQVLTVVAVLRTAVALGDDDGVAQATELLEQRRAGEMLGVWPLDLVIGDCADVVAAARGALRGQDDTTRRSGSRQ